MITTFCSDVVISGAMAVTRYLCRLVKDCTLYGRNNLDKAEVNTLLHY